MDAGTHCQGIALIHRGSLSAQLDAGRNAVLWRGDNPVARHHRHRSCCSDPLARTSRQKAGIINVGCGIAVPCQRSASAGAAWAITS